MAENDNAALVQAAQEEVDSWSMDFGDKRKKSPSVVFAQAFLDALSRPPKAAQEWRPIESAPKGKKLIVGYYNEAGNWRSVMAIYYPAGTLECDNEFFADADGYAPEGWYEESESHSEKLLPTDKPPTHWQPLPAPPTPEDKP